MKIVAIYDTWDQCSPDAFEKNEHIVEVNENTTIGDLIIWQRKSPSNKYFKDLQDGHALHPMRVILMDNPRTPAD